MQDIKEWIKEKIKAGYSKEQIREALLKSGYNLNLLEETVEDLNKETQLKSMPKKSGKGTQLTILLIIMILILATVIFFLSQLLKVPEITSEQQIFELVQKPPLQSKIVSNADLIFNQSGWFGSRPADILRVNLTLPDTGAWKGNGLYINYSSRLVLEDIIILHPISEYEPRYLEQTIYLPNEKKLFLILGLRNAGMIATNATCTDSIFKVFLTDINRQVTNKLTEFVVEDKGELTHYAVDISQYKNRPVTIRLESWAGGYCGIWNGEFGIVDYIDVINYRPE